MQRILLSIFYILYVLFIHTIKRYSDIDNILTSSQSRSPSRFLVQTFRFIQTVLSLDTFQLYTYFRNYVTFSIRDFQTFFYTMYFILTHFSVIQTSHGANQFLVVFPVTDFVSIQWFSFFSSLFESLTSIIPVPPCLKILLKPD